MNACVEGMKGEWGRVRIEGGGQRWAERREMKKG